MTDDTAEPQAPEKPVSRWEDYVDVFFSPSALFRRRADDRLGPPLIILLLASLVIYYLMLPANAAIMDQAIAANPQAAQAGQTVRQMGTVIRIVSGVFVPISLLVSLAFAAVFLWLFGRMMEGQLNYRQAMLIATYAGFVYLLAQLATGVVVLLKGSGQLDLVRDLSFGVLRFTGGGGIPATVIPLLRRIDIFPIWQVVIWTIGLAVVARIPRGRAALAAILTTVIVAIPGVIMAFVRPGTIPGQ